MGNSIVFEAAPAPENGDETTASTDTSTEKLKQASENTGANSPIISQSKAYAGLFTKMRDVNTSSADFVKYSKRAMRLLAEDAIAEFPSRPVQIRTPCGPFAGTQMMNPRNICAVSIVRSGDALLEAVRDCIPECAVGKILIQRDESNPDKPAKLFYSKMPPSLEGMYVLLCDPMLATGGSVLCALDVLVVQYNIKPQNIVFANMICAPEGLERVWKSYPKVKIVTVYVDKKLNEEKFITPGLGDYGDRYFNTVFE
jgi:uracil phosphoribosyltransferase